MLAEQDPIKTKFLAFFPSGTHNAEWIDVGLGVFKLDDVPGALYERDWREISVLPL